MTTNTLQKQIITLNDIDLDVKFTDEYGEIETREIFEVKTGKRFYPTDQEHEQIIDLIAEAL